AAASILNLQSRVEAVLADGVERTVDEIQKIIGAGSDEAIFWILRHLTANSRGYFANGDWCDPSSLRFSKN
ncbi:MAG: glucose-6-phosphate isomerase, partial [Prochlorococcus sp.]